MRGNPPMEVISTHLKHLFAAPVSASAVTPLPRCTSGFPHTRRSPSRAPRPRAGARPDSSHRQYLASGPLPPGVAGALRLQGLAPQPDAQPDAWSVDKGDDFSPNRPKRTQSVGRLRCAICPRDRYIT
jgi:hypothetical protein